MHQDDLIQKYGDIIKEEINIKEITELDNSIQIKKIFKPIWSELSAKFGKDTGKIIQFGKMGNIKQIENNQVIVFDNQWNERTLDSSDYEIAYEGLEWDDIAIDNEIIAKLDLEISPQLAKEWVAREISRFLNQMRKDAKYNVDDKVSLTYQTESEYLMEVIKEFWRFLQDEALIKEVFQDTKTPIWDISSEFTSDNQVITISLKR